jgi:hypothetical protein
MIRAGWLLPFLLAGCSTAPVAGLMDTIDSHRRGRVERVEPRPPPGGWIEPASRSRNSNPPADPPKDTVRAEPYDMPVQPVRRKGKTFEPKDKVRDAAPADDDGDRRNGPETVPASNKRRRTERDDVLPPPPLPSSDERDDF